MAEIEFERRGRPLWLAVLVVFVVVAVAYFSWTSCASLRRQRSLEPSGTPVRVQTTEPGSATPGSATPSARP